MPMTEQTARSCLAGQVALITGAAGGLGSAMACRFVEAGAHVVLNDLDAERAEAAALRLASQAGVGQQLVTLPADVSDGAQVERLFAEIAGSLRRLDVLVNNAGVVVRSPLKFHSDNDWHQVMRVNLDSLFYCSRAAIRMMLPRRRGRIINIASSLALHGGSHEIAYVTSKAGMIGFTKSLAREVGPRSIRVNAICPSLAETGLTRSYFEGMDVDPRMVAALLARLACMERPMTAQDVADVALFLASRESDYINGQVITLDGGMV
jgi:NAD(P)-dependent dehydrogenase (short-subunit alcohol dehydrogenase family)